VVALWHRCRHPVLAQARHSANWSGARRNRPLAVGLSGARRSGANVVDNLYDGTDVTVYIANAWLFGNLWFQPGVMGYLWPNTPTFSQYSVVSRGSGSVSGDPPNGWTVNWTSNGFDDHTTDTVTGQTGWTLSQTRTFSITP